MTDCYWHYTIGYEKIKVHEFFTLLNQNGVKHLIDVRWSSFSFRPEFRGSVLARICNENEIQYHHIPQLGIPSKIRKSNDRTQAFHWYRKYLIKSVWNNYEDLLLQPKSAIMCYERDHNECHRHILSRKLERSYNRTWRELRNAS